VVSEIFVKTVPVLVSNFESKINTFHFCSRKQKREIENERRKKTERNRKGSKDGKRGRGERERNRDREKERKLRDQNDVYRLIEMKKGQKEQKQR
jgi:hypothetical protein